MAPWSPLSWWHCPRPASPGPVGSIWGAGYHLRTGGPGTAVTTPASITSGAFGRRFIKSALAERGDDPQSLVAALQAKLPKASCSASRLNGKPTLKVSEANL